MLRIYAQAKPSNQPTVHDQVVTYSEVCVHTRCDVLRAALFLGTYGTLLPISAVLLDVDLTHGVF